MGGRQTTTYALITPARDEAGNLRRLADSLSAQLTPPAAWIIVDDGSVDDTGDVVRMVAADKPWVRLVPSPGAITHSGEMREGRGAGRDIVAFNAGVDALDFVPDLVVKLDADVSFAPDFFTRMLDEFNADPRLGIASGECYELEDGIWRLKAVTGSHARGATRAYRWTCFERVRPLEERLGWDAIDELKANEFGWRTQSIPDLPFRHHRPLGKRDGRSVMKWARMGEAAHYLGYRFSYLVMRTVHRGRREPSAVGMIWGYSAAALRRSPQYPDSAVRRRLREGQRLRNVPSRAREARRR
jgi:glycosyltransferase involved in cell wall biosynthesis